MNRCDFHQLQIWQKGIEIVLAVYRITAVFPSEEQYGLISQLRRAAVSIPSNIAEGNERGTNRGFIQFLEIAKGSLAEVYTQLEIANRLEMIKDTVLYASSKDLIMAERNMIAAFIKKLS